MFNLLRGCSSRSLNLHRVSWALGMLGIRQEHLRISPVAGRTGEKWTNYLGEAADVGEPWRIRRFLWKSPSLKWDFHCDVWVKKLPDKKVIDPIDCLVWNIGIGENHWPYLMRFDAKHHNSGSIMEKSIESGGTESDSERPYFPIGTLCNIEQVPWSLFNNQAR